MFSTVKAALLTAAVTLFKGNMSKTLCRWKAAWFLPLLVLSAVLAPVKVGAEEYLPWRTYVTNCVDTLIEHGTDRYGPIKTAMLMSIVDVRTHQSPEKPLWLDTVAFYEPGRAHRRAMRGSNFWYDQAMLRVMYRLSKLSGDPKYADAADRYIDAVFKYAVKDNGLLVWGTHIFYDAYADKHAGDGRGQHEILVFHPEWAELFRRNPQATRREVDMIWEWHIVDKQTGQHNRHDDKKVGCDFAFSGGSFALACAAMYNQTKEEKYLQRAKLIAGWHWRHRNEKTNLVPDAPSTGNRHDATHCFTTIPGPYASQLLRCHELTGDTWFRDVAVACLKAYDKWGYDKEAQTYHAMLKLDGTPVPEEPRGSGYDAWKPTGHVDVWKTTVYSYEFPLIAAQSCLYGYELTAADGGKADPELLNAALRWAAVIEKNLPPKTGRRWKKELEAAMPELRRTGGSYAEDYGRTISFFVHLYHATGQQRYLELAEKVAREAVDKLYVNSLFKGHPAKPYYEATQGVGILLHAILELDLLPQKWQSAF
jgi:hypothetical protein